MQHQPVARIGQMLPDLMLENISVTVKVTFISKGWYRSIYLEIFLLWFPCPRDKLTFHRAKHPVFEIWHSLKARFYLGCTRMPHVIRWWTFLCVSSICLTCSFLKLGKNSCHFEASIPTESTRQIHRMNWRNWEVLHSTSWQSVY